MPSTREFQRRYHSWGLPKELHGCSREEIAALESRFEIKLPVAYRAFLRSMGHDTDWLFVGTDCSYRHLSTLRRGAERLLARFGDPFMLHAEDFVFLMHQGYQFMYFRADENPDPPVFYYLEGYSKPERKFGSFSQFLESCIADKLREENPE